MKNINPRLITSLVFLYSFLMISGQTGNTNRDKFTLLTEPFNARSLTLYEGQLQFFAGYELGIRTKSFDDEGDKIGLVEDGRASIAHRYVFNVSYGILDFVEVGAKMNYLTQGSRDMTIVILDGPDYYTFNDLSEYTGFEDLELWLAFRPIKEFKVFDFSVKGGLSLPTARYEPDQPTHTIDLIEGQSYLINYHYNLNNGLGVLVWNLGASFKFRSGKFSFVGVTRFSSPLSELESIWWDHQIVNNSNFVYSKETYSYLPARTLEFAGQAHIQATGWLDLFMGVDYFMSHSGWIEDAGDIFDTPEKMLAFIKPGLEIQVSPLVRITETVGFAVKGQNIDAPFFINTSLSFNLMPFTK